METLNQVSIARASYGIATHRNDVSLLITLLLKKCMFTLPLLTKSIDNVCTNSIDDWHALQIVDFALSCIQISLKSKISLQITNFASNRSSRYAITSLISKRGVVTRTPHYFNYSGRKNDSTFLNHHDLFMGEPRGAISGGYNPLYFGEGVVTREPPLILS